MPNATDQARCVAARLAGEETPFGASSGFWSDQGDLKLRIAGLLESPHSPVLLGVPKDRSFSVLCFRDSQLIAVESGNP